MVATIDVRGLDFVYQPGGPVVLSNIHVQLEAGTRCLLVGANGAGKTTLLAVLGGRFMVPRSSVLVLGRPAFHDTSLSREVAFLSGPFEFSGDVSVRTIIERTPGLQPNRVGELLSVLDIDLDWHMHEVSDGQRRRVQIFLKLVYPARVLLLDEVTTDLDVVVRADLLDLLRRETDERGATIVYATHIFDGLDTWATHLVHMEGGRVALADRLEAIEPLQELRRAGATSPLYRLVEGWIRAEKTRRDGR